MAGGAFVLAGGRSARMGRDKAFLPYRGMPLAAWVASEAARAAGSAAIVGPPAIYSVLGFPCIGERYPGSGPLSGIEAALRLGGAEWNLILACDMPGVEAGALRALIECAAESGADAAAAIDATGRVEPLCAVYHTRILPLVQESLESGRLAVHDLLSRVRWTPFAHRLAALPANINTPGDWDQWNR